MIIESVGLRHFRNLESVTFKPHHGLNFMVGANGQGKTNLLEAIYFGATTRSPRVNDIKAMIAHGNDQAMVELNYSRELKSHQSKIVIYPLGKTIIHDGTIIKKASDYIGKILTVLFLPSDVTIVDGSPSMRRKLIDEEMVKGDVSYLTTLMKTNALLKQRNLVLKSEPMDPDYLEVISKQWLQAASALIYKRYQFIQWLNQCFPLMYSNIMNTSVKAEIHYQCGIDPNASILIHLQEKLEQSKKDEMRYRITMVGPQKDDIRFFLDGKEARTIASQGQKRALILSYKLCICQWIKEVCHQDPILLLDDVLSELDGLNQQHFVEMISTTTQTMITTTHKSDWFDQLGKVFPIDHGRIIDF